jgi:hypothetical protein
MKVANWIAAYYILVAILCVYWMFKSLGQVKTIRELPCVTWEADKDRCRLLRTHKL